MSEIICEQANRNDETPSSATTPTKIQLIIQNAFENIKKVRLFLSLRS